MSFSVAPSSAPSNVLAVNPPEWQQLADMLEYRRPDRSKSERKFINRFIRPLGVTTDDYGNLYKTVGDSPRILFSSHTDTVHKTGGKQRIAISDNAVLSLHSSEKTSNCLGADNTVGVWIMCEMIRRGIQGLYIFHRAEESGRLGSEWIAKNNAGALAGIDTAIAFDRRGTTSVITHQMPGRTCSDAFAKDLIAALGLPALRLDDGGTYTDTASYSDLIEECTNLSCGFDWEHSKRETLDLRHVHNLLAALVACDWSAVGVYRKPGEDDPWFDRWPEYRGQRMPWEDFDSAGENDYGHYEPCPRGYRSLFQLVVDHPVIVADILEQYGYDTEMLADEIAIYTGKGRAECR